MARVKDSETKKLAGWPTGLDNQSDEWQVPDGQLDRAGEPVGALRVAENLNINSAGGIEQREGYSLVAALPEVHSIYGHKRFGLMLAVYNGQLITFDADMSQAIATTLVSKLSRMSYDYDGGWVYFTNGFDSGRINAQGQVEPWALNPPIGQPQVDQNSAGGLAAGYYQVAITYRDANGRESGSTLAVECTLAQGQGLGLSNIPQPTQASVTAIRVYVTEPNAGTLRYARDLAVGMTSCVIGVHQAGAALGTQFMEVLPPGQIVRIYRGRMYVIRDNVLYWSEAQMYGQGTLYNNYLSFDRPGTLLEGVFAQDQAGMYAAFGERTYFLSGSEPKQWQKAIAHPYGAVIGSSTLADANLLKQDTAGDLPYWYDTNGQFVLGTAMGRVIQLHADSYAGPIGLESAATVLRENDTLRHFITTMRGAQPNTFGVVDRTEAEIWRDGVRIS